MYAATTPASSLECAFFAMDDTGIGQNALIDIVHLCIEAGKALKYTIQSFQNNQRIVKQLIIEIDGLLLALASLGHVKHLNEPTFGPLRVALGQCHKVCSEFDALMRNCSTNSRELRTTFRGWLKLRYMDENISGFTDMLALYKSTIYIAVTDANLWNANTTLVALNEYKETICSTTQDLEDHLISLDFKLLSLSSGDNKDIETQLAAQIQLLQMEQDSAQKCLEICSWGLKHVNDMHFRPVIKFPDLEGVTEPSIASRPPTVISRSTPMTMASTTSESIASPIHLTESELTEPAALMADAFLTSPRTHASATGIDTKKSQEDFSSIQSSRKAVNKKCDYLPEEKGASRNCNAKSEDPDSITTQKHDITRIQPSSHASGRVHILENVRVGDNGHQIFISTQGDHFHVRDATAGEGAVQVIGSISDASLQAYFQSQTKGWCTHGSLDYTSGIEPIFGPRHVSSPSSERPPPPLDRGHDDTAST